MKKNILIILIATIFIPTLSHASIFADNEARNFILELKNKYEDKVKELEIKISSLEQQNKTLLNNQIQFQNSIDSTNKELSSIRGYLETLQHETQKIEKKQDNNQKNIELKFKSLTETTKNNDTHPDFESALNLFKDKRYRESYLFFSKFIHENPSHQLIPNATFWIGNSFYALGDCEKSIKFHESVYLNFPYSTQAPESLLVVSSCYQENKDTENMKSTLKNIIEYYPTSDAAKEAKKTLVDISKTSKKNIKNKDKK